MNDSNNLITASRATKPTKLRGSVAFTALFTTALLLAPAAASPQSNPQPGKTQSKTQIYPNVAHDTSPALSTLRDLRPSAAPIAADCADPSHHCGTAPVAALDPDEEDEDAEAKDIDNDAPSPVTAAGAAVEQTQQGSRPAVPMIDSFDGLGESFPTGATHGRNPSDNSLAVGPDHIVQIVNSRLAVYSKKGEKYDSTGKVLYGPVVTNTIFKGFGGQCEEQTSGDAVVRYDQLAKRWLYVLPLFRHPRGDRQAAYSMCYAVSEGADPLGPYHRYEFKRPMFPDYPRPAIWPDGYYVPSSVGDTVIQKQACVADRSKMLQGLPATEQCLLIDGVNFLNNADVDGQNLPPAGAPNIMVADGGTQLHKQFDDDGLYVYKYHVDWDHPEKSAITGPKKIAVAPYHYLCDGQLTKCVPQPGTDVRLDSQGDKLMQRLAYRRIGHQESILALHSVATKANGGGVRWYELRLDKHRDPQLYQQGTYAPDGNYRWLPSMAMDRKGNIGVGYSFGGPKEFVGQRFTARYAKDPKGQMTLHETVLAEGKATQTNTLRWEDYTTTAMDPSDDCTFWYVGDYVRAQGESYSTRIGGFRLDGCIDKK